MDDALTERVEALERAVTDGDHDLSALTAEANALERLGRLDEQLEEMQDRVAELEAATQAVRGYVGNVRAVNEEVEQRADSALAKAESVEAALHRQGGDQPESRPAHDDQHADSTATPHNSATCTGQQQSAVTADGGVSTRHSADDPSRHSIHGVTRHASDDASRGALGHGPQRPHAQTPRQQDDHVSDSCVPDTEEAPRQTHCEACGQARAGARPTDVAGDEPETGTALSDDETDSRSFEAVGSEDPLVDEETSSNESPLSRFRGLL